MEKCIDLDLQVAPASLLISPPRQFVSVRQGFCRLPREVGIHYGAVLGSNPLVLSPRPRILPEAI